MCVKILIYIYIWIFNSTSLVHFLIILVPKSYCLNYYRFLMSSNLLVYFPQLCFSSIFILAFLNLFSFHINSRIILSTDTKKVLKFVLYLWVSMDWIYILTILSLTVPSYGIFLLLFTSTLTSLTNALYLHIFCWIYSIKVII